MTVGSDGGLKEGKKRTNGLNAPTLIILGAKKDAPDRPISPAEEDLRWQRLWLRFFAHARQIGGQPVCF